MKKQIYAINDSKCNVIFSSTHPNKDGKNFGHLYPLDSFDSWHVDGGDPNPWVQVTTNGLKMWIAVITQGRPNNIQWIKKFKVSYSDDGGKTWAWADDGKTYNANTDGTTKIKTTFTHPFKADKIKLHLV